MRARIYARCVRRSTAKCGTRVGRLAYRQRVGLPLTVEFSDCFDRDGAEDGGVAGGVWVWRHLPSESEPLACRSMAIVSTRGSAGDAAGSLPEGAF